MMSHERLLAPVAVDIRFQPRVLYRGARGLNIRN